MSPLENLDLKFDNRSILEWYIDAKREGRLDRDGLRRSMVARLIWKVSYQHSDGLIEDINYVMGRQSWGNHARLTLADDLWILRRGLANVGHTLRYAAKSQQKGFFIKGRPRLDPQITRQMIGAIKEVDIRQIVILKKMTLVERFAKMISMMEFVEETGVYRLKKHQPTLKESEALYLVHQGKVAEYVGRKN